MLTNLQNTLTCKARVFINNNYIIIYAKLTLLQQLQIKVEGSCYFVVPSLSRSVNLYSDQTFSSGFQELFVFHPCFLSCPLRSFSPSVLMILFCFYLILHLSFVLLLYLIYLSFYHLLPQHHFHVHFYQLSLLSFLFHYFSCVFVCFSVLFCSSFLLGHQ